VTRSLEESAAIQAVERACEVCRSVRGSMSSDIALHKEDSSPATVADFAAQAVASATLAAAFPGDVLVAEEQSDYLRAPGREQFRARVVAEARAVLPQLTEAQVLEAIDRGGGDPFAARRWVLDPLDGTKGFLRGGQYAVALALIEDGRVALGVLGCPELPHHGSPGALLVAGAGRGARWRPLQGGAERELAIRPAEPSDAVFCESVEPGHSSQETVARVLGKLGANAAPCRMDSQCKYAAVARGDAAAYLRIPRRTYQEKIWDHAAGALIVEEAGGRVTDLQGAPLDFTRGRSLDGNYGIVAAHPRLHGQILAAVQAVIGSDDCDRPTGAATAPRR
jgi:HAL2 family 3'(2'),5'-bisphosphate nucleotidase